MRSVAVLVVVVAGVCALPAKLSDHTAPASPVLVKDVDDIRIQVTEPRKGEYGVQVYQQVEEATTHLPTQVWTLPPGWHLPGKKDSRVVHAELLSTGDVVVVVFSLQHGLDLVLLPKEFFQTTTTTTTTTPKSHSHETIVFPQVSEEWHPTVSTPAAERWSWSPPEEDVATPSSLPYPPKPDKVKAAK
ncbi:uncharacterized protein LOC121865515 [Homarus americanus]|uniref:uncharacterized protein LOC121865515 n=1 Tax=Homarus americanus TaxID=6706 RepID=UPI001C479589|nr:uncharacterized protein LOC121865515 [Homarus americanus]